MRQVVFLLTLLCLLISSGGCKAIASLTSIKNPTAKVTAVELAEQSAQGAVVRVTVQIENTNGVALPIITNQYTFVVAGMKPFVFLDKPKRTLPGRRMQTLELVAAFDTGGKDVTGAAYRVSGKLEYQPPGQIRRIMTDSGIPLPSVSYAASGKIP